MLYRSTAAMLIGRNLRPAIRSAARNWADQNAQRRAASREALHIPLDP
jgi:hypothetical protein